MTGRQDQTAEVFAVGDVYLDRVAEASPWDDLQPEIDRADIALCNYEAPISDRGAPARGRAVPLRTPVRLVEPVARAWTAVSLAQNHVLDFGEVAAEDTLRLCAANGVGTAGLGRDRDRAWSPCRFRAGEIPLSLVSLACAYPRSYAATDDRPGVAAVDVATELAVDGHELEHPGLAPRVRTSCLPDDVDRAVGLVAEEAQLGRIVLVYVHWGVPGVPALLEYQVELGRRLAESGAAAVLGTHAHVLQAVEVWQATPILYGMSHAVFDLDGILTRWPFESLTYGARLGLDREGVRSLALVPFEMTERDGRSSTIRIHDDRVHQRLLALSGRDGPALAWDPDQALTEVSLS